MLASLHVLLVVVAVAVLSQTPCGAQAPVAFDPRQHLEGFADSERSAYPDVFDLARFRRESGKATSAARLAELAVLWRAERERGDARLRKIAQDSRQIALLRVEQKLRRDPFFTTVAWDIDDSRLPFVFLVQRSSGDDRLAQQTKNLLMPCLEAANQRVERDILAPAGLAGSDPAPLQTVMLLAGRAAYAECMRLHYSAGFYTDEACWVRAFDTLVVYRDPAWTPEQLRHASKMAQIELGVARLRKACTAPAGFRAWWMLIGLAGHVGLAGAGPDTPAADYNPAWVKALVPTLVNDQQRLFALPLLELVAIKDGRFEDIEEGARARGAKASADGQVAATAHQAFYRQVNLWCSYLRTRHGAAWTRCVQSALRGGDGVEALHAGWPPADLPALEIAFAAWLRAEHQRLAPTIALPDPLPLPSSTAAVSEAAKSRRASSPPSAASPAQVEPLPSFADTAAALALTPADWELTLAAAMRDAGTGGLLRAAAVVSTLFATVDDLDAQARIHRSKTRLEAALAVRQRLMALYADGKKVLDLDIGGKRVRGRVEKLTDARVSVRAGKDLVEVELDTFEPGKLDIAARRLGVLAANTLESSYLQILAEGARDQGKRKLAADDDNTKELANDLDSYVAYAALAEPAGLLIDLANGRDGRAGIEAIENLVRVHAALPAVHARLAALRQRARALLAAAFDPCTRDGLGVHAKVERVNENTVRVRYECKDIAELKDFTPDPDYLEDWKFDIEAGGPPKIVDAGGSFAVSGHGVFRLPLVVASPLRVEWRTQWPENSAMHLGFCDDNLGAQILININGTTHVHDHDVTSKIASKLDTRAGTNYTVVVQHDGRQVRTTVNGNEGVRDVAVGRRQGGAVLLHTIGVEPCYLLGLTLEWTLEPAVVETLRQRFVERRIEEIFGVDPLRRGR